MRRVIGSLAFVCAVSVLEAVSLSPRAWTTQGSIRVSFVSEPDGLGMVMPAWPEFIGYAWTGINGPLSGAVHVALRVEQTPGVVFRWDTEPWNTCENTPAQVRPFFASWDKGRKYIGFSHRWWSNPVAFVLGGSSWEADIPLDPAQWSGVRGLFGTDDLANWEADVAGAQAVGVSFGGGCFFGHGVGVESGSATVVITRLEVS